MATHENCWNDDSQYNYQAIVDDLIKYLKLKAMPIGMKRYKTLAEMESIPKLKRPDPAQKLNTDQIVGQCRWVGYTIGVTMDNLTGAQCGAVVGLHARDEAFLSGNQFNGVWYSTLQDSAKHQAEMDCASAGNYQGLAVSPLTSERLGNPDICLIYATPGQMITLINGLQWSGYKKLAFSCVGESSCADSWGRALKTGEPSLSIPCYAERKFGGVQDDELLIAIPPSFLPKLLSGLKALSANGLRYPIPNHGLGMSPIASMQQSYG
ncbi:MAG: hypothetical protein ACI9WS_003318 [Paraglaciecola psychrophila]|jgi:uncharacterized protein (DUF169 family)